MVSIAALWLPIFVSTVLVFVASSLVWMVLPHHRSDVKGMPDETAILDALRKQTLAPGLYTFPHAPSQKAMSEPAFVDKLKTGPVGMINVWRTGPINMGRSMGQWVTYVLVLSIVVAYLTGRTVGTGAPFLAVFRVAGAVASLAYASAIVPAAIWWGRPWNVTWKEVADGIAYGLITGATFGWLFPE